MKSFLFSFCIGIFLFVEINSQIQFQNFLSYVNSISDITIKNSKVDSFINYHSSKKIPVIEDNFAVFIYRGSVNTVNVAGDFNGWSTSSSAMSNLSQTNFFYFVKSFEMNARLDYKFVLNGSSWILDPYNPKTCVGGFGPNSELAMSDYIYPWEINYNQSIPHGIIETKSIFSINVASLYQLKIYLPPNYNPNDSTKYSVVYFQDGFEYIDLANAINVLDNLINANKIVPLIAIFVKPNNRNEEYAGNKRNQYATFFANELVPFVDSIYKTIRSPQKRLTLGDSYGGNISGLICYNFSNVFSNCGLHSGAFQSNGYEVYNLFVNNPKKEIKFASVWGTYESLFTNMRDFRDNLISKGYQFKWSELPEGHSWGLWKANIDFILEFIFPGSASKMNEINIEKKSFELFQNFPNPFNPKSNIKYQISKRELVTLKVFDILGREIEIRQLPDNEMKDSGEYEVEFDGSKLQSGVYFYQLKSGNFIQTKKMILLQ